jgi:hypothetical protein
MSPFEIYLRTGLIVPPPEAKFNPWHDVETGRFTFRNQGRYYGPDGGSGYSGYGGRGFGGGGASGSWDAPKPRPSPAAKPAARPKAKAPPPVRAQPPAVVTATQAALSTPRSPDPVREATRNDYHFKLDSSDRPREISGDLQHGPTASRSRRVQTQAGDTDRRATDEGGHYIASRFNGPSDAFNHFAQDRNFNRGAYREMERGWGRELAAGRRVHVRIVPEYLGNSKRPFAIRVSWTINGREFVRDFPNEPSGGRNER